MSVPALALAPALIDGAGTGASTRTLDAELLERAARDDYQQWLTGALAAGGCVRPIRLHGTIRDIDPATGEILSTLDTEDRPDKVIYLPCGDRRASVCPPCAETYRADTYQLIGAGLAGGKGVPESVAIHPCVFATFTARPLLRPRPHPGHHPRREGGPLPPPAQGQLQHDDHARTLTCSGSGARTTTPLSRSRRRRPRIGRRSSISRKTLQSAPWLAG